MVGNPKLTAIRVRYEDGRVCDYDSAAKIESGISFVVVSTMHVSTWPASNEIVHWHKETDEWARKLNSHHLKK